MNIGIPKEKYAGEKRVSVVPETVKLWIKSGHKVFVEPLAGEHGFFTDEDYRIAGAFIAESKELYQNSEVILKVRAPVVDPATGNNEIDLFKRGTVLVCLLQPFQNTELVLKLKEKDITAFALELLPRITRSQPMDVLTSQSMIAGYKAIMFAAERLHKFMPLMMTAAMTVRPAKVLVIGAGVAGLQAIATAKRLGAVVKAVDTRPAVKEQVESLGASFVVLPVSHEAEDIGGYAKDLGEEFYKKEQEFIKPHLMESDIVITTAQIPGRRAPILITEDMVREMKRGSIIVDLSVESGGNCSISKPGEIVVKNGVTVYGFSSAPSSMPYQSSLMFSKNLEAFLKEIIKDGKLNIDLDNEIIRETLVTHNGEIVNKRIKELLKR